MNEQERTLHIGIDICDELTQVSCMGRRDIEPVSVGIDYKNEKTYEFPTVLAVRLRQSAQAWGQWFYGKQALDEAKSAPEEVFLVQHILKQAAAGEMISLYGMSLKPQEALRRWLSHILSVSVVDYPAEKLLCLTITVPQFSETMKKVFAQSLKQLNIPEERYQLVSHEKSYMYYALHQKKELWMNQVSLFDVQENKCFYSQIKIDHRVTPAVAAVQSIELTEQLKKEAWGDMSEQEKEFQFLHMANRQLRGQNVTTLYVTGKCFEEVWAEHALMKLCQGRRVFRGQNLFTKGACYQAQDYVKGASDDFVLLDADTTHCQIFMPVYHHGNVEEKLLVEAGIPWKEVHVKLALIPDEEQELQLITRNIWSHEENTHLLVLGGLSGRKNKRTRFSIELLFTDAMHCSLLVKDEGFGHYYASTHQIWERTLNI